MTNRVLLLFTLIFLFSSCRKGPFYQSVEIGLNDNWSFRRVGDANWLPAKVPGNVVSDLLLNEKIEDPLYRDNVLKTSWIENEDWEYRLVFDTPQDILKDDQIVLRFAGLDTYADVYLNNSLVLKTNNMFRSWELPCKGRLKERNNALLIRFHSPVKVGIQKKKALSYSLPAEGEEAPEGEKTSMFTRKAQFQFGSEIGPRLLSCGIWRPVSLCAWNKVRIQEVHLDAQKISKDKADYNAIVNIEAFKPGEYDISFFIDSKPVGNPFKVKLNKGVNNEVFNFQITKPSLWWCNGMGSHYLYTVNVKVSQENKEITEMSQRFGVRKLELVQDSDEYGQSFYFRLNGVPIFAKGATYVPPDILNLQASSTRYETIVQDAVLANMNMIRIWGGGIYENDTLYDLCDRNGLLVWQDFMFSRTMQPGDKDHMDNIRYEAIENVKRLSDHPCMALWCGNDDVLLAWNKWGWKNQYPKDVADKVWKDYEALYHKMLRRVVENYSAQTPYWSSSPSSSGNKLPDKRSGDDHEWRIWSDMAPFSAYGDKPGRFVSAFGMQSFPSFRTLHLFANDSDLDVHTQLMDFRQRSNVNAANPAMDGNQMILNYIQMYYNDPSDFESIVYVSQVMQAEALKAGIEAHRINRPRCMGSLYWQLNDAWPTISWSTVDFYGHWKPAHYTVKRSFANVLVVPRLSGNYLKIFTVNDSMQPIDAVLRLVLSDFSGKQLWNEVDTVSLNANSVQIVWKGLRDKVCPRLMNSKVYMLVQLVDKQKIISENMMYFADPKFLDLPMPDISYQVKSKGDAYELVLVTDKLAKNIVLDTYEKDSHFSDNNFDLLPGREVKLTVTYQGTREELLDDIKIYSLANSF